MLMGACLSPGIASATATSAPIATQIATATFTPTPTAAPAISDPQKVLGVMDKYGLKHNPAHDSDGYTFYEGEEDGPLSVYIYDNGQLELAASGETADALEIQNEILKKIMIDLYGAEMTQQVYAGFATMRSIGGTEGTIQLGGYEITMRYTNTSWNFFFMKFIFSPK